MYFFNGNLSSNTFMSNNKIEIEGGTVTESTGENERKLELAIKILLFSLLTFVIINYFILNWYSSNTGRNI